MTSPLRSLAAAALIAVGSPACGAAGGGPSPLPSHTRTFEVTYSVAGPAPTASIAFGPAGRTTRRDAALPWSLGATVPAGADLSLLAANHGGGARGYRLVCTIRIAVGPGRSPEVTTDSSHIVGTLGSVATPTPIYTGDCEADAMVPTAGSP